MLSCPNDDFNKEKSDRVMKSGRFHLLNSVWWQNLEPLKISKQYFKLDVSWSLK